MLKEQPFVSRSLKNVQTNPINLSRTMAKDISNFDAPSPRQTYFSNPENLSGIKGYVRVPRRISGDKIPGD